MPSTRRYEDIVEAVQFYNPDPDLDLIQRAYMYSAKVHAGQVRKSGDPYLTHPLEVSYILTQLRLDEASLATGLLHDTVEDTLATVDGLRDAFGDEVATLVDGVTKLSQIRFDNDQHKQAENFRKMLVAMAKDIRVVMVKLCDRLHNMRTLEHMAVHKQLRIARETLEIYAPLANRLGINWIKSELEDLSFRYLEPTEFAKLDTLVRQFSCEQEDRLGATMQQLRQELKQRGLSALISGRPKHLYSIWRKMRERQIDFDEVYDVIAFRVIVENVSQCYEVLGHVHSIWHPIPGRFKDYIAMPKPNRYQSLHTSVIGPGGGRIEIQIRTEDMHRIAEEGIAAHWEYKEGGKARDKQDFAWLRQLLEWQRDLQDPDEFLDTVKYDLFTDEVFVFTPKGEVISLRRGATPVDFAFAVHTEVGLHCAGAKVNGRMVPLRYELKNGDMVEIITNGSQQPSKDWLNFVRTSRARAKIRAQVRMTERARSRELGQEMLERELRRYGQSFRRISEDGRLGAIAKDTRHGNADGLLVAIGYGRTTASQVAERLIPARDDANGDAQLLSKQLKRSSRRRQQPADGIVVQGLDDVLVRFGKCCSPLPGDQIVGFITRGRGITIHTCECPRAVDLDPERRIPVDWDENRSSARPVSLRVLTTDRQGLLATMSQVFSNNGVNIAQANCKVTQKDRAMNTFELLVKSTDQLAKVTNEIKSIKGVIGVERL